MKRRKRLAPFDDSSWREQFVIVIQFPVMEFCHAKMTNWVRKCLNNLACRLLIRFNCTNVNDAKDKELKF